MNKDQELLLIAFLVIGLIYCIYIGYFFKRQVEKLQNVDSLPMFHTDRINLKTSYAQLTADQKQDLSPSNMMVGEVYRYVSDNGVSFDVYGYLHVINGAVFEANRDQKYKIVIADKNGRVIVDQELKRDGDDVYKLILRDLQIPNADSYNNVSIKFVDESGEASTVVSGLLALNK